MYLAYYVDAKSLNYDYVGCFCHRHLGNQIISPILFNIIFGRLFESKTCSHTLRFLLTLDCIKAQMDFYFNNEKLLYIPTVGMTTAISD